MLLDLVQLSNFSFEFCKKSHLWKVKAEKRSPRSRKIPNDDNAGGAIVAA